MSDQDIRTELTAALDQAAWDWLAPHRSRGVVVMVAAGLNLVDVGVAIATDQVSPVQHWMSEGLLYKPSDEQVNDWAATPEEQRFQALIVQPYVLVQELEDAI